jgi:putative AlgH/UPF0301 family transcriptional regulator
MWLVKDPSAIAREVAAHPAAVRIFIGLCGWSMKQMESETARRLWIVSDASAASAFDPEPKTLWARLNERFAR